MIERVARTNARDVSSFKTAGQTTKKGKREKTMRSPFAVELKLRVPPGWCDGKTAPNAHKLAELGS